MLITETYEMSDICEQWARIRVIIIIEDLVENIIND